MITLVTILGSAHSLSTTRSALAIAQQELRKMQDVAVVNIEPAGLNLNFPGMEDSSFDREWLQETVSKADGVILATPEYHGSFSSLLKLVIENLGYPSALNGKPVSLIGVAGGRYGAIKSLKHLRSVCSHVGALVLPGGVSIAKAHSVFDKHGKCLEHFIEENLRQLAVRLVVFIRERKCTPASIEEMARKGVE